MIHAVDPNQVIHALAEGLKKELKPPIWANFVKTGAHKERAPEDPDWWFTRAAAVLRAVYLQGPIGTEKLRGKYGGKKNRGAKPERFVKGSGSVIRKVLQQLQAAGYIKEGAKGVHKGRVITPKGAKLVHEAAKGLAKVKPKPETAIKVDTPAEKKLAKPEAATAPKTEGAPAQRPVKHDAAATEPNKKVASHEEEKPEQAAPAAKETPKKVVAAKTVKGEEKK
jgi:small subunit ribosomal protein S19e